MSWTKCAYAYLMFAQWQTSLLAATVNQYSYVELASPLSDELLLADELEI